MANEITDSLKAEARRLGFELAGVCPAVAPPGIDHFRRWLAEGFHGRMRYLAERAEARVHPRHVLDGCRSILMLAVNYRTAEPGPAGAGRGRVSRYAWGADYHEVLRHRLSGLADFLRRRAPGAAVRGVVDTAPLLERPFAQLAGLGWIGKNTLLIHPRLGSWLFLAALLTDVELACDPPFAAEHCGTCRACLDACPTGALVAPYRLDARKCISYLTIELRGPVPADLRGAVQDWVFGCDLCQEVCPWNRRAPPSSEPAFRPAGDRNPLALPELFQIDDSLWRRRFRPTALWRARRAGLLRNAAIALGNRPTGESESLAGLIRGLDDAEDLVRAACAWALGRYPTASAATALRRRQCVETNPQVWGEIAASLTRAPPTR
jgi:epoxyqueuosine reductase